MIDVSILPARTAEVFNLLAGSGLVHPFYLSGGTGLALQLKHRESEDMDFFSKNDFSPELLQSDVVKLGKLTNVTLAKGTLNCSLKGVKLQFLHYPYSLLEKPILYHNISISSLIDIACTKLITISSRGSKKDFIDLYFLLNHYSLSDLFHSLEKKYKAIDYNHIHILKSLEYFDEAEQQPMPRMVIPLQWTEVKKRMLAEVRESNLV